jgi:hypothetical protein
MFNVMSVRIKEIGLMQAPEMSTWTLKEVMNSGEPTTNLAENQYTLSIPKKNQ